MWDEIVPVLLNSVCTEPWQFYANVILVIGSLEPENIEFKRILTNASYDSRPEVRSFVLQAIDHHEAIWTRELVRGLISDPDLDVRGQAKSVLDIWDSKQRH